MASTPLTCFFITIPLITLRNVAFANNIVYAMREYVSYHKRGACRTDEEVLQSSSIVKLRTWRKNLLSIAAQISCSRNNHFQANSYEVISHEPARCFSLPPRFEISRSRLDAEPQSSRGSRWISSSRSQLPCRHLFCASDAHHGSHSRQTRHHGERFFLA